MSVTSTLSRIGPEELQLALIAGIAHVQTRRDLINRINVFPVPDGDTGTNLIFTLNSVGQRLKAGRNRRIPQLLDEVADAALDGARGNSGAIMAQYFHGISESCRQCGELDARQLAAASRAGAAAAWSAMSRPVAGTMPTVLEDFGDAMVEGVEQGIGDIRQLFYRARKAAHRSLAETPDKLTVLRDAGVVDAGGQGFVDFLDGIWRYIRSGKLPAGGELMQPPAGGEEMAHAGAAPSEHRYCTECLIAGEAVAVAELREALEALDASSLVVAGGGRRARVHIHTDRPGDVFKLCSGFGEIKQQKADDMTRQHGLINQRGRIAVVTDSAADLPAEEVDRLAIHVVPLRLFFGDEEFLDKLSIQPSAFYARLADSDFHPQTSQPPPRDFRRQFELLTSHGHEVLAMPISGKLSGTCQAAEQTAARMHEQPVTVYDTRNAACGQALMTLFAAEAAANRWPMERILGALEELGPRTRTFALARDLSWGVKGGRVKPWMHWLAGKLRLNPVLANTVDGRLTARGVIPGRVGAVKRFARYLTRRMDKRQTYRILISHTDAEADARRLRELLLTSHPEVDACWVEEASPAVGVHAGPGSLIVGLQPWRAPEAYDKGGENA
ncbi:MAG: DegV family EDD domain-containing protein [Wenzhouxiangellaceae bacterium]|nr:DegV family EDD domain-containing protein [Wenzhouxiangellaceae bacterium]MBS3747667.1 DegV family EDD domain-containing protein [Wenzhouxiangellaceae bacterium]MBS3822701.1 DegV family EDD domain-containing protein [Wenzhouxiangellaceae bacterium]